MPKLQDSAALGFAGVRGRSSTYEMPPPGHQQAPGDVEAIAQESHSLPHACAALMPRGKFTQRCWRRRPEQ
eukprot:9485995-Pyramimonas_sp.AAC.2